jgi:hypothetical protein
MDIYSKAQSELNSIDQQIAALQRRQVELRQFVALGHKLFNETPVQASLRLPERQATQATGIAALIRTPRPRDGTMKSRVLEISEMLINRFGPIPTKALVDHLQANGVEISGSDKGLTVSVILSRSDRFKADRSIGWTLSKPKENPQDAPTSAGSTAA